MPQLAGLSITSEAGTSSDFSSLSTQEHQAQWEKGAIDYSGIDRSV